MTGRLKHYNFIHLGIRLLVLLLMVLAVLYVYFLCASIRNVVMREELEQDIGSLSSSIGELEAQYFALERHVDLSQAESLGLVELSDKQYVARNSKRAGLTLND